MLLSSMRISIPLRSSVSPTFPPSISSLGKMVDAFISIAIEKLVGLGEEELKLLSGTREEVEKLLDILKTIRPYLHDAEVKQFNEPEVGVWLKKLKYGAYEADDVLDEWQTKSQQLSSTGANLVWNFFAQCTCFRQLALRHTVGKKIQKINGKLDDIHTQSEKFKFLKSTTAILGEGTNFPSVIRNARKTTSSVEEIFGREDEIKCIKDKLINSSETSKLAVVSIVGPAGFGKTTLAKHVFNDDEVKQHFKERIWVCVSDEFDVASIMRKIIEAATKEAPSVVELEALQKKIVDDVLKDKLFLLVLDDVWNEDYGKWNNLFSDIKNCGWSGSRIVVTTRSEKVCKVTGGHMLQVGIVSSFEDCWSIFKSVAFESRDGSEHPELRMVGEEIVKKCKCVPLAIKTVAGVLRTETTREDWERVLKSDMWDWQPKSETGILPALLLSYYYLSPPLKQCFRYCVIYPKDHYIRKDDIVQQWIAHGYVSEKKNMEMEDVGENYFDELVERSLFQERELDEYDSITYCKMHDLVHDLAQFVTKGDFLHVNEEKNIEFDAQYPPLHCTISNIDSLNIKIDVEKLRTFICTPYNERELSMHGFQDEQMENLRLMEFSGIQIEEMRNLRLLELSGIQIEKMRNLRLLKLSDRSIEELPHVAGKLVHLRYLNLSGQKFKALPRSIGELQNLLYLDLSWTSIEAFPESVGMLRKLRHLDLSYCKNLKALLNTIGRLTNLRKLDLKNTGLDEITSSIGELQNLLYLDVSYSKNLKALPSTIGRLTNLRKLDLTETGLVEIPSSIGELQNLLYLKLAGNKNLKALPSTTGRLTNLRNLDLTEIGLDEIPDCIGKLASLQVLNVSWCKNLEKLPESMKDLSHLQVLDVNLCKKLEKLPDGLFDKMTGLKKLSIYCSGLRGLPAGIGKLTCLQSLDQFPVAGNHDGSSSSSSSSSSNIWELGDLDHLHGSLTILNLDMVTSGEEASRAQLHNKSSLSMLILEWGTDGRGGAKEKTSEDVLQSLRPCPTLPELVIEGYPGCTVPTWLGNSAALMLSGLQELWLRNWDGCPNLPALGNLPELQRLVIAGMPKVRTVGAEWFAAFPKLKKLEFRDMAEFKSFFPFPCLSHLEIWNCPKLRSLPSLPNLEHLTIRGDDGVLELSNDLVNKLGALKSLYIDKCPNLESLPQEMASLKQLRILSIWNCPKLEESCNKDGAQWYKIQHIPSIEIDFKDVRQNALVDIFRPRWIPN